MQHVQHVVWKDNGINLKKENKKREKEKKEK